MKALQSDLFKRMAAAGININEKLLKGEPIVFEGVTYIITKVRRPS